jgi:membrane-anchored protein YejM (alkaline phosphatase superfamily)
MSRKEKNEDKVQKKVYVNEETWRKLFTYKYTNKFKNIDEVINDLLNKIEKSSK